MKQILKRIDFPDTADMRSYDGIEIVYKTEEEEGVWLEIILCPIANGRPEFVKQTRTDFFLPFGRTCVNVPFSIFDHSHLVYAHMQFVRSIELYVKAEGEAVHTELYAAREVEHPWILHKQREWSHLTKCIQENSNLYRSFQREYEEKAQKWMVPEPFEGKDHVYISSSQDDFLATVLAWKLLQKQEYLNKAVSYIKGFLDEKRGYLATEFSYFQFTESREEYDKGDFSVHRACSAGWVQEGEFMTKMAIACDLLYDRAEFTVEMHKQMELCMRNYMEFESWRLTDEDGNNFQLSED